MKRNIVRYNGSDLEPGRWIRYRVLADGRTRFVGIRTLTEASARTCRSVDRCCDVIVRRIEGDGRIGIRTRRRTSENDVSAAARCRAVEVVGIGNDSRSWRSARETDARPGYG